MMSSEYIIDVSESDFQYQVVAFSNQTPVVVDFWAEWCVPCKILGPILEKLTIEAKGAFRLAKVNADQNPTLTAQYQIHSIPAVKAFRNGQVVAEFSGTKTEPQVREFLRTLAPTQVDLTLEKGLSLLNREDWSLASTALQKVLQSDPDRPEALLGLAKSYLAMNQVSKALAILRNFPPSKEYSGAELLLPLADMIGKIHLQDSEPHPSDDPLYAAFTHNLKLVGRGNIPAALDGLLDVMKQDKTYRDRAAHKAVLGLLELLGDDNPLTQNYRNQLASILF
jgi:putative thioredoxin